MSYETDPTAARARAGAGRAADGYAEASRAFDDGVTGTAGCFDFLGSLTTGWFRANARFFEEMASTLGRSADEFSDRMGSRREGVDYERLADLVAARLRGPGGPP